MSNLLINAFRDNLPKVAIASVSSLVSEGLNKFQNNEFGKFKMLTSGIGVSKTLGGIINLTRNGIILDSFNTGFTSNADSSQSGQNVLDRTEERRVILVDNRDPTNIYVEFLVMPQVSERRNVTYSEFQPLHHPGHIMKYRDSSSRSWGVNAKLVSRSISEADQNVKYLNNIRSWSVAPYGNGTRLNKDFPIDRGAIGGPPSTLTFSGIGESIIPTVPVVLTSYSWTYPNDVDYIETSDKYDRQQFPVILDISLELTESYSPNQYSNFSLGDFRNGDLTKAYGGQ